MEKFKNKYRIQSARLQNWDYRWAGAYFITICTQNREHYFGEIINGKMKLSEVGVIADILWHQIPYHTKNTELGAFVVMPNHIHGILIITGNDDNDNSAETLHAPSVQIITGNDDNDNSVVQTLHAPSVQINTGNDNNDNSAETLHAPSLRNPQQSPFSQKNEQMAKISPKQNSVSTIVRSYKSAVTKHAHRLEFEFQWQTRFHDHIIRNDKSFQTISNYIINNPANWQDDKFFIAD